jgi:hypothetical protein
MAGVGGVFSMQKELAGSEKMRNRMTRRDARVVE